MAIQTADSSWVLVAEDEENDALLLRQAFLKVCVPDELLIVPNGQEAIHYLSGDERCRSRNLRPLPRLLLLDLKMPHMTGFDVLAWLSERPEFKDLPRVVLSSSSHESDARRALRMGAWDYQIKPHSFDQLVQLVRELNARWLAGNTAVA